MRAEEAVKLVWRKGLGEIFQVSKQTRFRRSVKIDPCRVYVDDLVQPSSSCSTNMPLNEEINSSFQT